MVLPEHFADNHPENLLRSATAAAEANDLFYRLPPALRPNTSTIPPDGRTP